MDNKRRSVIWKLSKEEFEKVVKENNTYTSILKFFGLKSQGGAGETLKKRLKEENIDCSHIKNGYSSNNGRKFAQSNKLRPLEEVMIENSNYDRGGLKKRILKNNIIKNECAICGQIPIWNGKEMVMILDHINGIYNDHRIKNLRFVCPNCNSQLPTFSGRNQRIKISCSSCGKELNRKNKHGFCCDCFVKNKKYGDNSLTGKASDCESERWEFKSPLSPQTQNERAGSGCKSHRTPGEKSTYFHEVSLETNLKKIRLNS